MGAFMSHLWIIVEANSIVGVLKSIYRRNCAVFEESMKVSMDKLWVILNKFRGGHKWNMQISGRGTSFQNGYSTVYGIALIMANERTDSGIFLFLKVKIYFHMQCVSISCTWKATIWG